MTMNIYKQRYINALKKCAKVNRLIDKGYRVFHDGHPAAKNSRFILKDGELLWKASDQCFYLMFENSRDWDHGYWTKISDWNNDFEQHFEVFQPTAKVKL